MKKMLNVS